MTKKKLAFFMSVHTYIPSLNHPQKHPDPSMHSCFCRGTHSSMFPCAQTTCTHIPCSLLNGPNSTDHCCCLGTKSCLTLCDPMDYSAPGSSALHCFQEFA